MAVYTEACLLLSIMIIKTYGQSPEHLSFKHIYRMQMCLQPITRRHHIPLYLWLMLAADHCDIQQVVDLQLLVDSPPVVFHQLFLLLGQLIVSLLDGTLLFHIISS